MAVIKAAKRLLMHGRPCFIQMHTCREVFSIIGNRRENRGVLYVLYICPYETKVVRIRNTRSRLWRSHRRSSLRQLQKQKASVACCGFPLLEVFLTPLPPLPPTLVLWPNEVMHAIKV